MKKKELIWNVYVERNGIIEAYNIIPTIITYLKKLKRKFKKEEKEFLIKEYSDPNCEVEFGSKKYLNWVKKKKEEFSKDVKIELMYQFWGRCEWEIIITDWPTFISKEEVVKLKTEIEKYPHQYRYNISLETQRKIDVYSQIGLNYEIFIDYLWNNLINI